MLDFHRTAPAVVDTENIATPLELARTPDRWNIVFGQDHPPPTDGIRRYHRREIAHGMYLYSADEGARILIVGFSGQWMRLMLPVAAILQNLDSSRFDLLLLWDERISHYRHGIQPLADAFYPLCVGIDDLRRSWGYREAITFGTSMGALPALRAAEFIHADRAIGIGARFAWDVHRITEQGELIPGFDPLCACRRNSASSAYALHGEAMATDAVNVQRLVRVMPDCRVIAVPHRAHNLLIPLLHSSKLASFLSELFDLTRTVDGNRLQAMFVGSGDGATDKGE